MGRINLQSLIDEVLGMAKDSQNIRKKKESDVQPSWYGGNKDEEQYWKDMRARNTQIEVGKMQNAGQMDVARENNTGQLARQTLMEDTKRIDDARDYNLDLYKTQIGENVGRFDSQTKRMEAITKQDALNRPDGSKEDPRAALFTALSQPGMTEPEKVNIRKTFDSIYGGGQPATQPAGSQRNIPPPDGILSDKKPSDVIKPASRGVDSMEFASDDVLKKR